ncbi:MAG: MFS transporter [Planctomycetes bacterium]|nr:MFS transporter [Planctomycetota bacterium]
MNELPACPPFLKTRLSIMMFLQYAVWGIWLPVLGGYLGSAVAKGGLGFTGTQIGMILGTAGACGAILAPFIAGQVADRFMNAEKALGILVLLGAAANWFLASAKTYDSFLAASIVYSVLYMPTLSLSNSIAMTNLPNSNKDFPRVRVWGTIGWIVGSAAFPLLWLQDHLHLTAIPWFVQGTEKADATALVPDALRVSAVISLIYCFFAFSMLPKTPPKGNSPHPLAFLEAFALLKRRGVLVLTFAAVVISMIHNIYFIRTASWLESVGFTKATAPAAMTVGQMVELCTFAVLGWFIAKLGFKRVLTLGAFAYFLRFACFASATSPTLAYAGIALHGLCYPFFFACGFLFIDGEAPADARHSAQTAYGIAILGVGPILAGVYNGFLDKVSMASPAGFAATWQGMLKDFGVAIPATGSSWPAVWWTESAMGAVVFLAMLLLMPNRKSAPAHT